MYPRPSLNLRQRPKLNKTPKEGSASLLSSKLNQSLHDLSSIVIQDDDNLLSPDHSEFKSRQSIGGERPSIFHKKEVKEKRRDSLVSRFDKNITPFQNINYEKCLLHGKAADLICIEDRTIVCCNCALFGQHKGHDVINLEGLLCKLTCFTQECLQKYENLKELQENFNEEIYREMCEQRLMQRKQEELRNIEHKFNELIHGIKQIQKKTIIKLQSTYKQKLVRLTKTPELMTLANRIEKWYESVEGLSEFIENSEDLQTYVNSVKYIDGNGFGDGLLKDGDKLVDEIKELQSTYEDKLNLQIDKQRYFFNDKIKKDLQNYCQLSTLPKAQKQEENLSINALSQFKIQTHNISTQEDNLLASIVNHPENFNQQEVPFENIPTLSISQIKFNACTMSSNQSSDCSRYLFKENHEAIVQCEQKKKKKFSVSEKFKGTIDDLKNDRAETIDLTGAELGDANIMAISEYIGKSKKLKVLKLIKNKLTDECIQELFLGLKESKVSSLNLSQNNLSEKAILIMQKFMVPHLKNITLTLNKINRRNIRAKIQAFSSKNIHLLL